MTPRVFYLPPNPPARRGGTLLIALGIVALLYGMALLAESSDGTNAAGEPRGLKIAVGVVVLAYATGALVLGLPVRNGGQTSLILALIPTSCAGLLLAFLAIASAFVGMLNSVLLFGILGGMNALCAGWLIRALARPIDLPFTAAATPRVPLQEYYLPPVEPAVDVNRYGPGVAR